MSTTFFKWYLQKSAEVKGLKERARIAWWERLFKLPVVCEDPYLSCDIFMTIRCHIYTPISGRLSSSLSAFGM